MISQRSSRVAALVSGLESRVPSEDGELAPGGAG